MEFHNKAYKRFEKTFKEVDDFRQESKIKHLLIEILFIAVVATIAGADGWIAIGTFAESKEEWLRKYIPLNNGVPSHDTFERVFENIDVRSFDKTFINWTERLSKKSKDRIIAVDGKTVRRSHDGKKRAIHIVNAWVDENDMILGQLKTDEKSNEITAIPELLQMLFLKGSIVTIDAMGTQKKIAAKIIEKGGDYVLALKGNHQIFSDEVKKHFEKAMKSDFEGFDISRKITLEKSRGRVEKREYFQTNDVDWYEEKHLWLGFTSIGMVRRTTTIKEKTTVEVSYYISSLAAPKEGKCELFAKAVRKHWGIESCHWILDVVFREDDSRVRKNNGASNLSGLKKIALNALKAEKVTQNRTSLKMKRYMAGLNEDFLAKILEGMNSTI